MYPRVYEMQTCNTQQRVSSLKDKAAAQLVYLLSHENVCYFMNYLGCYGAVELNATISYILQTETDKVLASPFFLELSPKGLLKLLEKEMFNVPEIEIWRAALLWAKHRAKCEEGPELRKELATPLKHIRICTVSLEDFHQEVTPTRVLTDAEVRMVCSSLGTKEVQEELTDICNRVLPRNQYPTAPLMEGFDGVTYEPQSLVETKLSLATESSGIELLSLELLTSHKRLKESKNYKCKGSFKLTRVSGEAPHLSSDVQIQFDFSRVVSYNTGTLNILLNRNEQNILLLPHASYDILLTFTEPYDAYAYPCGFYSNGNFSVNFSLYSEDSDDDFYDDFDRIDTHITQIIYRTIQL